MEVRVEITKKSYIKSVKALIIYTYKKVALILGGVAIFLTFFSATDNRNFGLLTLIYKAFLYFILLILLISIISFFKIYRKVKNILKEIGNKTFTQTFELSHEGVIITSVKTNGLHRWFEIKNIYLMPDYIGISLRNKLTYSIPKSAFSNENDEHTFFETVKQSIAQVNKIGKSFSKPNYKLGFLGLVPLIGGLNGVVMVIMGIFKYKDIKYILIGIAGILFTIGIYGSLIYYQGGDKPGFNNIKAFFNNQDPHFTRLELNSLVKEIEFYKIQHGSYPHSLQQLNSKDEIFVDIHDSMMGNKKDGTFNYHKIGNKYTLFSSGEDQIPNTGDDVYPTIDTTKTGLIIKKR